MSSYSSAPLSLETEGLGEDRILGARHSIGHAMDLFNFLETRAQIARSGGDLLSCQRSRSSLTLLGGKHHPDIHQCSCQDPSQQASCRCPTRHSLVSNPHRALMAPRSMYDPASFPQITSPSHGVVRLERGGCQRTLRLLT